MSTPAAVRRVLVAVPDLFFATRIFETARAAEVDVDACAPADLAARVAAGPYASVMIDLHATGAVEAVRALRATDAGRAIPVIGFYSHVDQELRAAAVAAGVTQALPRSAFTVRLADLLRGA